MVVTSMANRFIISSLVIIFALAGCENQSDLESESFSIGGNISGLNGDSLIIQNSAADDTTITENGHYTLLGTYSDQSTYNLSIVKQPTNPNQHCRLSKINGIVDGEDVIDADVTCLNTYSVNGEVFDLNSRGTITVGLNSSEYLEITEDGAFQFDMEIENGQSYNVIQSSDGQPVICDIVNGSGVIDSYAITDVYIYCNGVPVPALDPDKAAFRDNLWVPILIRYCTDCHREGGSGTGAFADPDSDIAYIAAMQNNRIDRNNPANSLLVTKLSTNRHMCWTYSLGAVDCVESARQMEGAISAWVNAN
jgi:hypothetical protein